jgi:ATP-binding cassette subfamily C protein LapB
MVMLSRMILRQPQVVLLDEPTAAMDEQLEEHVIRQSRGAAQDLVTRPIGHNPAVIHHHNAVDHLQQRRTACPAGNVRW